MWLRSAPTTLRAILLLCALPFLSSCDSIPIYAGGRTLADAECEAVRSDRERGIVSTAWDPAICERKDKERIAEARKIVQEADQKAGRIENTPPGPGGQK